MYAPHLPLYEFLEMERLVEKIVQENSDLLLHDRKERHMIARVKILCCVATQSPKIISVTGQNKEVVEARPMMK